MLQIMVEHRILGHTEQLQRAKGASLLLQWLCTHRHSYVGRMLALYEQVVAPLDAALPYPGSQGEHGDPRPAQQVVDAALRAATGGPGRHLS